MTKRKFSYHCAQGMAQQHPDTFTCESIDWLREHVRPGVFVKVCIDCRDYDDAPGAERIWTKVVSVDDCKVTATLANTPYFIDGKFGDSLEFELRHIYSFEKEDAA
jgi:hypothetical protein